MKSEKRMTSILNNVLIYISCVHYIATTLHNMSLCNVVAMFLYANILFAKLLMVTWLSPKSCLTF